MSTPSTTLKKTGNYSIGLAGVIAVLLIVLQLIPAASNKTSTPAPEYSNAQLDFMTLVSDYRDLYVREYNGPSHLDQEQFLERYYLERNQQLDRLIKTHPVVQWKGTVSKINVLSDGDAYLEVALLDDSKLQMLVASDSDLYQALRAYREGSVIRFSGQFEPPHPDTRDAKREENQVHFVEKSFTQYGSMEEPEFKFHFTAFHG